MPDSHTLIRAWSGKVFFAGIEIHLFVTAPCLEACSDAGKNILPVRDLNATDPVV